MWNLYRRDVPFNTSKLEERQAYVLGFYACLVLWSTISVDRGVHICTDAHHLSGNVPYMAQKYHCVRFSMFLFQSKRREQLETTGMSAIEEYLTGDDISKTALCRVVQLALLHGINGSQDARYRFALLLQSEKLWRERSEIRLTLPNDDVERSDLSRHKVQTKNLKQQWFYMRINVRGQTGQNMTLYKFDNRKNIALIFTSFWYPPENKLETRKMI